jgi:hypothetical protein
MMMHQKPHRAASSSKKVKCLAALAFFLCATHPSLAVTNIVTGTAYGTADLSEALLISSVSNGPGSLTIGFADTKEIVLNHDIDGFIKIENNFSNFTIHAQSASISSGSELATLFVSGGTNLTITDGHFLGAQGEGGIVLPPTPGQPPQTNTFSSASAGGLIRGTQNASISKTDFSGTTFAPGGSASWGTDALRVTDNASVTIEDFGSNSSTFTGGHAAAAGTQGGDTYSIGGTSLLVEDSTVTIKNGTFKGGDANSASAASGFDAFSVGGDALYAENATIEILKGSFTGGSGGTATGSGNTSIDGGAAIRFLDSTADISGGTFTGGSAGSQAGAMGGTALYAEHSTVHIDGTPSFTGGAGNAAALSINSQLIVDGGTFTGGAISGGKQFGLVNIADAGQTNHAILNGGTFSSIDFLGSGTNYFTAQSNLTVQGFIAQDEGTVIVDNLSDLPFKNTLIRKGEMLFINDFTLADGGTFSINSLDSRALFPNLNLDSGATLYLDRGRLDAAGTVNFSSNSIFVFSIVDRTNGLLTADSTVFETNSTFAVDTKSAGFQGGSTTHVTAVETTSGIEVVDSDGNNQTATSENFENNINIQSNVSGRTTLSGITVENGKTLKLEFSTLPLRQYWDVDGQMGQLADELDEIDHQQMLKIIDTIDDPALSAALTERTYFTTMNTFQTSLLGLQAALGQSSARSTEFRSQLKLLPLGAKGPDRHNDIRGWGKYYGHLLSHNKEGLNEEYDTSIHGGVIGIDKSFGNLLLGLSGGAGRYSTTTDHDSEEDITAYHGAAYATVGGERAYLDAGIAFGFNEVETETAAPFILEGEFDARLVSVYLGGGYDLVDTKGGTVFTPEASVQYTTYEQDGYTETSTTAVPREIDDFDAKSLRTSLGINTSMLKSIALDHVGFKVDARLHWIHELMADPDDMTFSLEGGSYDYSLTPPSLEENLIRVGIGASFFNSERHKPQNVLLRLDFDELFGEDFNSHNFSAKVVYAF